MADDAPTIAVIGLPRTGKTTFLAALWYIVGSEASNSSLSLERLDGHQGYLNEIRDKWADCVQLDRTTLGNDTVVSMKLRDNSSGVLTEVVFTDTSGESFQNQWQMRTSDPAYHSVVRRANGCLFFIHPGQVKEIVLIQDARVVLNKITGEERAEVERNRQEPRPPIPHYASTQVQLVELLQFFAWIRRDPSPIRVGFLISAWDLVGRAGNAKCNPNHWLSERLPLLRQYLDSNRRQFECKVFGVSAQGGELSNAEELRKNQLPTDRIVVDDGKAQSSDIALPLRWVIAPSLLDLQEE